MKKIIGIMLGIIMLLSIAAVHAVTVSVNDYDPIPAEAGKPVNVWFKITNPVEDPVSGIEIEVIPRDGLTLTPGEDSIKTIGLISGRSNQIIQFRLLVQDDAFKGPHSIQVKVHEGTSTSIKDLSIEVTDKDFKDVDLAIGDIESDPARIKPFDENVKLVVTLQNLGDGVARGVKTELIDLPDGVTLTESYSGMSLLGNIDADSTSTATYYIDLDSTVEPIAHTANLKVSYKFKPDEDDEELVYEEKIIPLSLAVKPIPIYEITDVEIEPTEISAGDKDVIIKITIKNIGEEEGESVRLKAYGKTEQPFKFDRSSDFISPSLKPGETGQGSLEIKVDDDAVPQEYYLDLEIKNIVNDDVITYDEKIPIVVANPKPDNPWKFAGIGVALIVLAIVIIIVRAFRKKKHKVRTRKAPGKYGSSYLDRMKED